MVKLMRTIMLLSILITSTHWLEAQVKIGDNPLDIGQQRMLEMERDAEFFIVTDSLEFGLTTSALTNSPATDALMLKLYGYGLGNFTGAQSYFLGTNSSGEVLEFPLTLDLQSSSTSATLSLFNGTTTFGDVDMTLLDSVFSTNTQLQDSIDIVRMLIGDVASDVDSDLDTIQTNELIDEIRVLSGVNGQQTLLRFFEDRFEPIDSERDSIDLDLDPFFATDIALADTTIALRQQIFYLSDGMLTNDRVVNGDNHHLTFTNVDSFNISSSNTTLNTSANTTLTSAGTTDISSQGDITISSTSNSNIILNAASDSIGLVGTIRLDEYVSKPLENNFINVLGLDANGNIINVSASTILGTDRDSTIYSHNGTLIAERTMTMGSVATPHNLFFVSPDFNDSTIIASDGRVAIGTGSFTPNSTSSNVKLEVNGDILAVRVHSSSDRRFKKNIHPIHSALDKVMSITGVTYDFKTEEFNNRNFPETKQVGFIAQNVEEVLPEVVRTNGDGYKAVDYAKITALLNEAIKEQQAKLNSQDELIKTQQSLITSLSSRLDQLASDVNEINSEPLRTTRRIRTLTED